MSSTVFKENNYRFFFFSREEERKHVHIVSADGGAKFCLEPKVELAQNHNLTEKQLSEINKIIINRYPEIIEKWNNFFS